MKLRLCQLLAKRLSPVATIVVALGLTLLMIFTEADQTTCLIALAFIISFSESNPSRCLSRSRDT